MSQAQASTVAETILKGTKLTGVTQLPTIGGTNGVLSSLQESFAGKQILQIIFYALLFLFVIFIILTIIHSFIRPIFQFSPGQAGYIYIPGGSDGVVWWNGSLPDESDFHPNSNKDDVSIASTRFDINYTVSVDVFLTKLEDIPITHRILFWKGPQTLSNTKDNANGIWNTYQPTITQSTIVRTELFNHCKEKGISLLAYLNETNSLEILFINKNYQQFVLGPFGNVPILEPFRITLAVRERSAELYINGRLAKTISFSSPLTVNGATPQAIYPPINNYSLSLRLQNLHIWPRPISASEVYAMSPHLPSRKTFESITRKGPSSSSATPITPEEASTTTRVSRPGLFLGLTWPEALVITTSILIAGYIFRPIKS